MNHVPYVCASSTIYNVVYILLTSRQQCVSMAANRADAMYVYLFVLKIQIALLKEEIGKKEMPTPVRCMYDQYIRWIELQLQSLKGMLANITTIYIIICMYIYI